MACFHPTFNTQKQAQDAVPQHSRLTAAKCSRCRKWRLREQRKEAKYKTVAVEPLQNRIKTK